MSKKSKTKKELKENKRIEKQAEKGDKFLSMERIKDRQKTHRTIRGWIGGIGIVLTILATVGFCIGVVLVLKSMGAS